MVRLAVGALARTAGLDEEKVDEVRMVVTEAATNAVMANEEAGADDRSVTVRWTAPEGGPVTIEVEDQAGRPDEHDPQASLDSQGFSTRHALSYALVESMVDSLETIPGPEGTITRLTL